MKKYIVTIILLLEFYCAHSQDSAHVLTPYAGVLASNSVPVNRYSLSSFASARIGAKTHLPMSQKISFDSWGIIDAQTNNSYYALCATWITVTTGKIKISAGNFAPSVTEFRPLPASASGQFETWTQSILPGKATGVKIFHAFSEKNSYSIGTFVNNNGLPLASTKITFGKTSFGGHIEKNRYSVAFGLKSKNTNLLFVGTEKNFGSSIITEMYHGEIQMYADIGVDRKNIQIVRAEGGLFKDFTYGKIQTIYAIGYQYEQQCLKVYIFVYI